MNGKGWLLPILGLLAAYQPALRASTRLPIGAVTGNGPAHVNGVPVPAGAVLYSGDRVATGPAGRVSIRLRKSDELVLGPSTDVRVAENGKGFRVLLDRGKVAVAGGPDGPVLVRAGGMKVEPGPASGLFEVTLRGGELEVWARRGVALVKGHGRTLEVAAGSLMRVSLSRGHSSGGEGKLLLVTIIPAAAAAAAGTGIAVAGSGATCVSPSQLTCP